MLTIANKMNGKLRGVWAINTNPLSNPFCAASSRNTENICSMCYAQKAARGVRHVCVPAWEQNGILLSQTDVKKRFIKSHVVRFNAFGELINRKHAENYFRIASENSHCMFALWTKRPELVQGLEKPNNLILVYSSRKIGVPENLPEGFDKVFTVFPKDAQVDFNCAGKCIECMLCYSHNDVVYVNEKLRKK